MVRAELCHRYDLVALFSTISCWVIYFPSYTVRRVCTIYPLQCISIKPKHRVAMPQNAKTNNESSVKVRAIKVGRSTDVSYFTHRTIYSMLCVRRTSVTVTPNKFSSLVRNIYVQYYSPTRKYLRGSSFPPRRLLYAV